MNAISRTKELNKLLRNVLIVQSELQQDRVLNSLSLYGEDLDKLFEEQIYTSIDVSDAMILFELRSRNSSSDVSMTLQDGTIEIIRSFSLYVMIYGDDSADISSKLIARFRTEKIRNNLHNSGIYIENVSDADMINEFKNNVMWLRNDFSIDISCKFIVSQIEQDYNFDSVEVNKIYNQGGK